MAGELLAPTGREIMEIAVIGHSGCTKPTCHRYEVEVVGGYVTVFCVSRTQAMALVRRAGHEPRSVNMVG
jgi:hypothetical protein